MTRLKLYFGPKTGTGAQKVGRKKRTTNGKAYVDSVKWRVIHS